MDENLPEGFIPDDELEEQTRPQEQQPIILPQVQKSPETFPPGFIPKSELQEEEPENVPAQELQTNINPSQPFPPGFISQYELEAAERAHGKELGQAEVGHIANIVEKFASGLTAGFSEVAETRSIPALGLDSITTPEQIEKRGAESPLESFVAEVAGGTTLLAVTQGLGLNRFARGPKGRIAVSAIQGAMLAGIQQYNDQWSKDQPLDSQKIAAASKLGALWGIGGGILGEAIGARIAKYKQRKMIARARAGIQESADAAQAESKVYQGEAIEPEVLGSQPTTVQEMMEQHDKAILSGNYEFLPAYQEAADSANKIAMRTPFTHMQLEALKSEGDNRALKTLKLIPSEFADTLNSRDAIQKAELVAKTNDTIAVMNPFNKVTASPVEGGKKANGFFTKKYQAVKASLDPFFKNLEHLPTRGDIRTDAIDAMTKAVPKLSQTMEISAEGIAFRPWGRWMEVQEKTYNVFKESVKALEEGPNNLESLWNVRKHLDDEIPVTKVGMKKEDVRTAVELGLMKKVLLDQMVVSAENPTIRESFRKYAINEAERAIVEGEFGASVGKPELGIKSEVVPENIQKNIFYDTTTVQAAKDILPPDEFMSLAADWLAYQKSFFTNPETNGFSSHRFGRWMKKNEEILKLIFQGHEDLLERLRAQTVLMRTLPDAPSGNPSGSATTLMYAVDELSKGINFSWQAAIKYLPKKYAKEFAKQLKYRELNIKLAGPAKSSSANTYLKEKAEQMSNHIDTGVKSLFIEEGKQRGRRK